MASLFETTTLVSPNSAFGSYAARAFGEDLVLSLSNSPGNDNGGMLAVLDSNDNLTAEYVVNEQGIHDIRVIDDDLFVVGTDPLDDWTLGNLYRRQNGAWEKIRTMPNVIHAFGALKDGTEYFVATGAHTGDSQTWSGRIYKSADLQNWTWQELSAQIGEFTYTYRVMDIAKHGSRYYAILMWPVNSTRLLVSDDGENWTVLDNYNPAIYTRMIVHGDKLVMVNDGRYALYLFDTDGDAQTLPLPQTNVIEKFNALASEGARLYFLAADGYIWRTADLSAWERYSYVPNAISLGAWPSQACLVASEVGVNAKLWKIPL